MNQQADYQAYLLRLERNANQTHWRVTLKDAHTGEQRHFANEEAFVLYLLASLQRTATEKPKRMDEKYGG
ncbi:MAG: hypothetical protein AAF614_26770 [Chloroflexota bacterium]